MQGRIQDFFRRGCTRLLLYFNTNTNCTRKPQVISGEGAHPLHPPPRSAPGMNVREAVQSQENCVTMSLMTRIRGNQFRRKIVG